MELLRLSHGSTAAATSACASKPSLPAAAGLRRTPTAFWSSSTPLGLDFLRERIHEAAQASRAAAFVVLLTATSTEATRALDYDELVKGATTSPIDAASAVDGLDFSAVDSVQSFVSDNPAAVIGGLLAVAVPFVVARVLGKPQPWGTLSAKAAYEKLAVKDPAFQLLDIREPRDIKVEGTPDLREFKKRVVQLAYTSDDAAFVEKVKTKFKDPASTTLYILDRFDGNSPSVAKLLATNGFKEAYAIKDGAEGQRGWQKSDLPWLLPRKGFSFNLDTLKDVIQFENDLVPATLGVAAAAGVGFVVFSEAETALQLLGTAALLQLFAKKFLFAEDRKKTLKELQTFLDTKVAPKELVDELKGVGKAVLPKFEEVSNEQRGNGALISDQLEEAATLVKEKVVEPIAQAEAPVVTEEKSAPEKEPAAAPTRPLSPYIRYPELKPPSSPQAEAPVVAEEKRAPDKEPATAPTTNTEVSSSRPLSPYIQYPELKPPTSPTPSKP